MDNCGSRRRKALFDLIECVALTGPSAHVRRLRRTEVRFHRVWAVGHVRTESRVCTVSSDAEKLHVNERVEYALAEGSFDAAQAGDLLELERHPGHLQILSPNSLQQRVDHQYESS